VTDPFVANLDIQAWIDFAPWTQIIKANWPAHVVLYGMAKFLRARNTLEIGIGQQALGTYVLGHHAKEVGGHHTGIDVSPTCINRANIIVEKFELPVTIIHQDSKTVPSIGWLDLIYVDGGHSEEQVLGDIANFSQYMKVGSLMIFDDYGKKHLQVTEAVDATFDPEKFDMMAFPRAWWAIWRRK